LGLTKQNTTQGYSAEQIKEAIGNQGRQPQSSEDCYVPPQLLDWHKQISINISTNSTSTTIFDWNEVEICN